MLTCQSGQIDKLILESLSSWCGDKTENTPQNSTNEIFSFHSNITKEVDGIEVPSYAKTDIILRRQAYTANYDKQNKIPKWVSWHLTREHTFGPQRRLSNFIVDEQVPAPRAEIVDYKDSGYDRGHMCPAGDNKWGFEPMRESFLLTNICPQNSNLNCGDWNELEILCRDWANKYGDIYIVCGPILYKREHKTIGPNKVTVPEAFFKVVLCMNGTPKAIGFIYKNNPCNNKTDSYVNTIDQVERITGIDFFSSLPDEIENEVESKCNFGDW
jgi:endonuclease G